VRTRAADRRALHHWQERLRDPAVTVLLGLYICVIFVALPLAARGQPLARTVGETLVLLAVAMVVILSNRWGATTLILVSIAAIAATALIPKRWPPLVEVLDRRGGDILAFSALTWVVAHAVYAPGRITARRLQGAAVVYLSLASIFSATYQLIWELNPAAFINLHAAPGSLAEASAAMYFSLTTLTTTGYGDIVAVDPFARSLANLESIIGVFYIAITVTRLVTLELEDRRDRRTPPGD
jgi:Ion channel